MYQRLTTFGLFEWIQELIKHYWNYDKIFSRLSGDVKELKLKENTLPSTLCNPDCILQITKQLGY